MKPIYITHTSIISPQHQEPQFLTPVVKDKDCRLNAIEPDYAKVIPPMQLRRMSRLLKMGVYCGMDCILQSGIERPDGIITGTAKGSMSDTEKFVKELKTYDEEALNPTPFIMSTYNAINGAIALQTKATGYNQTFVHRGSSLEMSLYDAQLNLNSVETKQHYLVGAFDEITDEYFLIKSKINYWKQDRDTELRLWEQHQTEGSIAGEGATFFMISNKAEKATLAIQDIQILTNIHASQVNNYIGNSLHKLSWKEDEIDLLVLGLNGDKNDEEHYKQVLMQYPNLPVIAFKHLSGEHETSGGFGLWLVFQLLQKKELPGAIWYKKPDSLNFQSKKIIYYNHYRGINHNIMMLSAIEEQS